MEDTPAPRLYLVTPERFDCASFAETLDGLLGHTPIACLRLALGIWAGEDDWRQAANHLLPVCHDHEVALVIEEHYRLVRPLGLDGVHLKSGSAPVRSVRKELGADAIVGADGGVERHLAITLAEAGADYVSIGPVADTGALGAGDLAPRDIFEWWAEVIETPVVAEGGVTLDLARDLSPFADFVVPDRRLWDDPATLSVHLATFAQILALPLDAV